jgi:hypothetical protein
MGVSGSRDGQIGGMWAYPQKAPPHPPQCRLGSVGVRIYFARSKTPDEPRSPKWRLHEVTIHDPETISATCRAFPSGRDHWYRVCFGLPPVPALLAKAAYSVSLFPSATSYEQRQPITSTADYLPDKLDHGTFTTTMIVRAVKPALLF